MSEVASSGENYLLRAVDPKGRRCVERVLAPRAEDAIEQLAAAGYTDIQLETDELTRAIPGGGGADQEGLAPRDLARIKRLSPLGNRLYCCWLVARSMGPLLAVVVAMFAVRRLMAFPLGSMDAILGLASLAPLAVVLFAPGGLPRLHRSVQIEYLNGRYDRVLKLVGQFERQSRKHHSKEFVAVVAAEWRAKSLARTGKLDEALAAVEPLQHEERIKPVLYWHIKAMTFAAAKRPGDSLECYKRATEVDPANPLGWLGLLESLAIQHNRPAEARSCLDRVRSLPMSPELRRGTEYSEGVVLFAESKFADARARFESVLPHMQRVSRSTPIGRALEAVLRAQLAIACVRTGDHAAARTHFRAARPLLERFETEPLLSRCRNEIAFE